MHEREGEEEPADAQLIDDAGGVEGDTHRDDGERVTTVPTRPVEPMEGWAIDWRGAAVVVLIAAMVFGMWRWLGDPSAADKASNQDRSDISAPTDTVEEVGPSTTPAPTTTTPPTTVAPTTSTVAPDRQVLITGEMKPCQFGANCLVASFTIEGFDEHPGRFVCIYPNSRRDFGFNDDGVVDACLTADAGDTITIEIDGIPSKTISEDNLDGSAAAPENG